MRPASHSGMEVKCLDDPVTAKRPRSEALEVGFVVIEMRADTQPAPAARDDDAFEP